jgi:3-isopropylmalate/(R)-2-methylmalate dehydratase small subunit
MAGSDVALTYRGRAWVFGDGVNTDDMFPGFALALPVPEAAQHMFNATRPGWPRQVSAGDVLVGGRNFGMGSSRPVPLLLRELGISCVAAEEFSSLFLRNCINYGLPAVTVPGIRGSVAEGQEVSIDIAGGVAENTTTGARLRTASYPAFILEILSCGGILAKLERDGLLRPAAPRGE